MAITPSQRITLIKEIADRLKDAEWALIDLTLTQFSLPVSSNWDSSKSSYLLKMLENAADQVLIDLGQHVGFTLEETTTLSVEPLFWDRGMLRVFLTHLASNRGFAGALKQALHARGISLFVAHDDIEPTAEWELAIQTALSTCEALVALLHPQFHNSNWTDQEVGFAMGRGVPVFAVHLGQTPYGFIGRFQAFSGGGKTAVDLAQELFDSYRKNKQTRRRMGEVMLGLFERSGSFADAKARIGDLEELDFWEPSFSARIKAAVKSNSQVSDAWGVSTRVDRLVDKWDT